MEILRETRRIQSDKKVVIIIASARPSQQETSYCCDDTDDAAAENVCGGSTDLDKMMMTMLRGRVMLAGGSGPGCNYKGQCILHEAAAAAAAAAASLDSDNNMDHHQLGRPGSYATTNRTAHSSPSRPLNNSAECLLSALSNSPSCCHDHQSRLLSQHEHHNKYRPPLSCVNQGRRSHSFKRLQKPTVIRTTNTATRRRKWERSF